MSRTEHHIGKLTEVKPNENETQDEFMLRLLKDMGETEQPSWCKTVLDWFKEEGYRKYYMNENRIFRIETKDYDDDDISIATEIEPGVIAFQLKFYNGGASFNEAMDHAFKKLKS